DRGVTEFAPPGREEGGSDDVDAMAVGIGLDDASEAGGGEPGGQHCGIVAQGRLVDLRPDQGLGNGERCRWTSLPPTPLTGVYRDPVAGRGLGRDASPAGGPGSVGTCFSPCRG